MILARIRREDGVEVSVIGATKDFFVQLVECGFASAVSEQFGPVILICSQTDDDIEAAIHLAMKMADAQDGKLQ